METAHRRRLESYSIKSEVGAQRRGQIFALVIALVVIGCGVVLTFAGRSTEGIVAMIAPVAGLAAVFSYTESRGRNP